MENKEKLTEETAAQVSGGTYNQGLASGLAEETNARWRSANAGNASAVLDPEYSYNLARAGLSEADLGAVSGGVSEGALEPEYIQNASATLAKDLSLASSENAKSGILPTIGGDTSVLI